jgi:type IV pilus assembly protein PilQ
VQNIGVNWGAQYDHISHGRAPYVAENAQTLMGSRWNVAGTENSGDISPSSGPNSYNPGELFGAMSVTGGAASLGAGFLNRAGSLMLNAELTAMEHSSNTRIISAPRIMASNDQEVYIKQGDQIPISNPATATASATTELVDAAMELRVTPHIEENGEIITLDITITKNEVGDTFGENTGLKTNEAGTKLMVRNGETVVIGGIIVDRQINTSDHVPGLHSIPLLGWLFKSDGVNNTKQELLIFLTANIIPITV